MWQKSDWASIRQSQDANQLWHLMQDAAAAAAVMAAAVAAPEC